MNYELPTSIEIDGIRYPIRSDYRVILDLIEALTSSDFSDTDRAIAILNIFYLECPPQDKWEEAIKQAFLFISLGVDDPPNKARPVLVSWSQDFNYIISAVNNVAGTEVRTLEYCHWWTFVGYYDSIDAESTFANIVAIRNKRAKGKKLEKWEREWYEEHKHLVNFKQEEKPLSEHEQLLLKSLRGE